MIYIQPNYSIINIFKGDISMPKKIDHVERHKYACHKSKAKARGIPFNLTYEQWWNIWQSSGKWDERGPGLNQYVMSRINDQGGYELNNVIIQLASQNKIEGNLGRKIPRSKEHQKKLTASIKKTMSDPNWINPKKDKPNPLSALNGKKGAKKQSQTVTGRKRQYNNDGTWIWKYPYKETA
jgi:hypothetical protein